MTIYGTTFTAFGGNAGFGTTSPATGLNGGTIATPSGFISNNGATGAGGAGATCAIGSTTCSGIPGTGGAFGLFSSGNPIVNGVSDLAYGGSGGAGFNGDSSNATDCLASNETANTVCFPAAVTGSGAGGGGGSCVDQFENVGAGIGGQGGSGGIMIQYFVR